MKLLLDTQMLLWAAGQQEKLSKKAASLLADPGNELMFSPVSLWEVVVKSGLGRADFRADAALLHRGLVENGYTEIPVTGRHATAVAMLPPLHKDPFDRLLVAQATLEGVMLVTADDLVRRYPGPIHYV